MNYGIYAIKDVKVGFMQPFIQVNDAVAVREFRNIVNTHSSMVSANHTDMELYKLGTYNQDTGSIESNVSFLIKGVDVYEPVNLYADVNA